jgi:ankyrin repeat protein
MLSKLSLTLLALNLLISCGKEAQKIPFLSTERDVQTTTPTDSYDSSSLFFAIERNDLDLLLNVLNSNAVNLDSKKHGETALSLAIKLEYPLLALTLLDHAADVNTLNDDLESPLGLAFKKNINIMDQVILSILERRPSIANPNELIQIAFNFSQFTIASKLLEISDVNFSNTTNINYYQYLITAYAGNKIEQAKFYKLMNKLLNRKADIHLPTTMGSSLLIHALDLNLIDVAEFLLAKGINVNAKDNEGRTALTWSVITPNLEKIDLLLEHGADKKIRDHSKKRACGYARKISDKEMRKAVRGRLKCIL